MKIMMIAPGRSILSNNWATAMCDRGHTLYFVTQESFTENNYSFVDNVDQRFIIKQLPYKGKKGFFLNGPYVKKIMKEINPDIIHVQQAFGYGFLGTFTDKKRAFVSVYGWEVYDKVKSKLWKPIISYIMHWYKHIGSTSYCMRRQIYKVFPDLKTPIVVTPFGIDMNKFAYKEGMKDEFVIGTVKKMDRKYGIEFLIKAFAKAYARIKEIDSNVADKMYLELVGPGQQVDELKIISENLGISDRTRFIGRVAHDNVPYWLNRFDIYCAPSILDSESFGVAVIEASACRRPVIVSNAGGLPEVVEDGVTGYVVEKKNVDALSDKIIELTINSDKRIRMGLCGEKRVKEHYEWQKCVDLMEDVYKSITDGSYTIKYTER
ncbi:glycosyltransferase family 4 protein [Eubacteriaceae bacterium Marseille-Q4139]|nr:glycosyltransferase family 4 protein [Eubacteriaceae bacterium Marseille-Q4139]